MNFYGIRELSNNTKTVLSSVTPENLVVITDNGKPTALMIKLSEETFEETLSMWKQMQLSRAVYEMQCASLKNFPKGMTEEDIEAEISAYRRGD